MGPHKSWCTTARSGDLERVNDPCLPYGATCRADRQALFIVFELAVTTLIHGGHSFLI